MRKLQTEIIKINFENNSLIIICKNSKLKIDIKEGNVDVKVTTTEGKNVGYAYLELNDKLTVYYLNIKDDYIIPKNIIINTKYILNSESSDSESIL